MATHSSIFTWKSLWTEQPGGLLSTGLKRTGHNWVRIHTHGIAWEKNESLTFEPVLSYLIQAYD